MKLEKVMTASKWHLLCIMILGCLSIQMGSASVLSCKSVRVILDGKWDKIQRSAAPITPVNALICDGFLTIQNTDIDCGISICILNNQGEIVLQKQIVAESSAYIVLSINDLPAGDYQLELTNSFGGYLYGSFCRD